MNLLLYLPLLQCTQKNNTHPLESDFFEKWAQLEKELNGLDVEWF
jgi:hypothetical protein